ncbi:putative membrane protein [Clostridioides difficile P28]|nr:putative membrane protein [Clostridioides difficile P28]
MLFQFTDNMDFRLKKGIRCVGAAMFMFTALVIFLYGSTCF